MSSRYVRLSNELLLEFVTDVQERRDTDVSLRRIVSDYDGTCTLYNERETGNFLRKTKLITDKYDIMALSESGVPLSSVDRRFRDEKCDLRFYNRIGYNKCRLHILCGYNMEDIDGFGINVFIRDTSKVFNLADVVFFKLNLSDVIFSKSPKRITESVFDRFVEFEILSMEDLLEYAKTDDEMVKRVFGEDMQVDGVIHVETYEVKESRLEDGFRVMTTFNKQRTSFPIGNEYKSLRAELRFSEDGTCIEFHGSSGNVSFEDFIYRLNASSKLEYFVQHEIRVVEQVGSSFIEQDTWISVQNTDFDKVYRFRPVIENKGVTSMSIDYRMTIMNSFNQNGISVEASISTRDIQNFQGKLIRLNAPIQNLRVVNKIVRNAERNIKEVNNNVLMTKYITKYVSVQDVTTDKKSIEVVPFRTTYKLIVSGLDAQSDNKNVFLVYVDDYGNKHYTKNVKSDELIQREYLFIMEESTSLTILRNKTRKIYLVIMENEIENVIETLEITT